MKYSIARVRTTMAQRKPSELTRTELMNQLRKMIFTQPIDTSIFILFEL